MGIILLINKYSSGNTVFTQGSTVDGFHLIINGGFEIIQKISIEDNQKSKSSLTKADKIEIRVMTIGEGDYFGLYQSLWEENLYSPYTIKWITNKAETYFMPLDQISTKLPQSTKKIMIDISKNKENLIKERVEFIRKFNIDMKQGYNKLKIKSSLPDINAKGVPLKIQFTQSSKVEGFLTSTESHKRKVIRVTKAHDDINLTESDEPSIEKPKRTSVTPRRQSMTINSNDLALGKPMSPISKRDLLTWNQK